MLNILRRVVLIGTCLAAGVALAQEPPAQTVTLRIDAPVLYKALIQFTQQAGLQLIFREPQRVADLKAPQLSGSYTPRDALDKLLKGSGFTYEFMGPRAVAIYGPGERAKNGVPGSDPAGRANIGADTTQFLRLTETSLAEIAQAADAAGDAKKNEKSGEVEEMIVEESKIKPFNDANADIPRTINDVQPYYIFDSETIKRSAAFNVEDFLKQRLTMNASVQNSSQRIGTVGDPGYRGSGSTIDLRGLGADKTLVLINGRRVPGVGGNLAIATVDLAAQADLNGIPMSAIDRIEVLPSSASGIYGASALGGVINVILKKDYQGGEITANYDNTWDTDAPQRKFGGSYGFNVGRTQIGIRAQWSDAEPLLMQDRRELYDRGFQTIMRNTPGRFYASSVPFLGALPNITSASEVINGVRIPDPGVLRLKDGTSLGSRATHINAGTAPGISMTDLSAMLYANRGVWNFDLPAVYQDPTGLLRQLTVTPTLRSFGLSVNRELRPGMDISLSLSRNTNNAFFWRNPNIFNITISRNAPFNPFDSAVQVTHPNARGSARVVDSTTDIASLGITSRFGNNWTAQLDYTWSHNHGRGFSLEFDSTTFQANQAANLFNPFVDLLLYPLNISDDYMKRSPGTRFESTLDDIALRMSGPLFELPAGAPNLTTGFEHRSVRAPQNYSEAFWPLRPAADTVRYSFPREQTIDSFYGEILVPVVRPQWRPLLHSLELQLAGRVERFAVDTGTYSQRITLSTGASVYDFTDAFGRPYFSRATYTSRNQTIGFKYQPVKDLMFRVSRGTAFLPPTPEQLVENPSPEVTNQVEIADPKNGNVRYRVSALSGGNPNLLPQNAKNFNAGLVWTPSWRGLNGLRFNAEYYKVKQFDTIGSLSAQDFVSNESNYPDRVQRNSTGTITFLNLSLINLYSSEAEGWDLSLDHQFKTSAGTFALHFAETIALHSKSQFSLYFPETDAVGYPSEGGPTKYKSTLQVDWSHRNWAAGWSTSYFSSYKQACSIGGPCATRDLARGGALYTYWSEPQGPGPIPSQMYHDAYIGYAFDRKSASRGILAMRGSDVLSGMSIKAGVKNVFNTLPPFDTYYDFYISPVGDTRLRSYWLSVQKSF